MMEQFAGSSVSGSDVYALEAAGKELEAKRMQEQQEQAKAAQIAYIKEHHCIVVPDLTQLLSPHFGNWIKEGERSGPGGDLSWVVLSGTLSLSKEN